MTSSFVQNSSRFLPDFFNQISSGNYGNNTGNTNSYSPAGFGGLRNSGSNLGSLFGMSPNFQASMGLQPSSFYGSNLSFYGSSGENAPAGSFGIGTGTGGVYFRAPGDINESPSFETLGSGDNAQYGAAENTINSNFSYSPQYDDPFTSLNGVNARGGAARALISDRSGTSYGDTNYNMNKPGEYNYRQNNYTPFGLGLSEGSGRVSGNIVSPNANDVSMDGRITSQQGGYANQKIQQGQSSDGDIGALISIDRAKGIPGLLGQTNTNISDFATVNANATNNALNEAQLRMQGNINSQLNANSKIDATNISPIFGNPVNAGVDLGTSSNINLNTGNQGFAQGSASSNTVGSASSGLNQTTTATQNMLTGKPKYYTYKTPEGTLDITTDQNVAAQAASFNEVDPNSTDYKKWVSTIPNSIKEDFGNLQKNLPGIFGSFPDFDSYAAFQYSSLKPNAQSEVNQNTTGTVYNDLGKITTQGNQYVNLASGNQGNIAAYLSALGTGNATSNPTGASLNTKTNLTTDIGAEGNTFGVFDNNLNVSGNTTNIGSNMSGDINSLSNARSSGIINTNSRTNTLFNNNPTENSGVFGVAPIIPGTMQGPTPVVIPPKPNNNIKISTTNDNTNSISNAFVPLNSIF